jgi:TM2 domain-containing membrane protein YozV
MQQKSWAVALILSIFFGVLGIDRFYLVPARAT